MHGCFQPKTWHFLENKIIKKKEGLPLWFISYESTCHCRGHRFQPWSRKIPHYATKPMDYNYWAWALESLDSETREATIMRSPHTQRRVDPTGCNKIAREQQRGPSMASLKFKKKIFKERKKTEKSEKRKIKVLTSASLGCQPISIKHVEFSTWEHKFN